MLVTQRPNKKGGVPRQNPRKQQGSARRSAATGPQQFESNVRFHHRFRYIAQGAVSENITDTQCVSTMGGVCTVNNTLITCWTQSFKVKRIEIWSAPASQGSTATCSVEWFGFGNSPNIEESDTSLSVSKNAYINSAPPPTSLAAFWQKATGTNLFKLTCPIGSIIDIVFDAILSDDEAVTTASVAAGIVGTIYYLYLDNGGSDLIKPVSLVTTT
jgi:hypothetical protein